MRIEPQTIRQDEPFRVSFDVTNTGQRDGDEVVQLYIHDVLSSVTTYEKNLRGFDRVHLKAGETRRVTMQVRPQDLSLLNERMERVVEPGDFDVLIGASSTDIRLTAVWKAVRNSATYSFWMSSMVTISRSCGIASA